jgi:hypothetical protein
MTTTPRFATEQERRTYAEGMRLLAAKGWKPPETYEERQKRQLAAGMKLVAAKLAAVRPVKSLAAPAAATVATARPFTFTAADVAAFKQAIKTAIKPTLLAAVPKAKAAPPAPPARRTLHRIFHHGGLW